MHDFVPIGITVVCVLFASFILGWFIKPVFEAQIRHDCETTNLAAVNGEAISRWCNDPENFK